MAIIGGGVGGIAAALWCQRLALQCILLEQKERLGGQLYYIHNRIPDYPGLLCTGPELADHLTDQLEQLHIVPQLSTIVQGLDASGHVLTNRGRIRAKAIIAATGATRRTLEVEGVQRWLGKGVAYTYSGSKDTFSGCPACIIGGGDGAFENALMMADICESVTLIMRRREPRARRDFVEHVEAHPRIRVLRETIPVAIEGTDRVESIRVSSTEGEYSIPVGAVLIKIGFQLQTGWLGEECEQIDGHALQTSSTQRTSHPQIWSVGDLCTPQDPSISVAVGQACLAVRDIKRFLHPEHPSIPDSTQKDAT